MTLRIRTLSLLAGLMSASSLVAHEGVNLAMRVALSKEIYPKLTIQWAEDLRTENNFYPMRWLFSVGEINYQLHKKVVAGMGYVNIYNFHNSDEIRNRYFIYMTGKHRIGNFTFSLRERFQSTYKKGTTVGSNRIRSKFQINYQIPKTKVEPFGYVETYNAVGQKERMRLDRVRFSGGFTYKFNRKNSLECYYRYHIFKTFDPVNFRHALGTTFRHQF